MTAPAQRGTFVGTRAPGPFHCVGCQTYVTGTPSGHCPRCGWVPPVAVAVQPPPPVVRAWPMLLAVLVIAVAALVMLI